MYICRMKLNIRQEKFCNKYVECGNASEAYRFAYSCKGWKAESVNVKASQLLNTDKVRLRVEELKSNLQKKSDIKKEQILEILVDILGADIKDYINLTEVTQFDIFGDPHQSTGLDFKHFDTMTKEQRRVIKGVKMGKAGIELQLHDKLAAIERICKMLGYDAPIKNDINLGEDTVKLIVGMKVQ